MTVRQAVPADAKKLHALEGALFAVENFPLSLRSFYYHIRRNLLFVAVSDEGDIAGYALTLVSRRTPKLYSLGVALPFRGRGIAAMLLECTVKELAARGYVHLRLEVRCDNLPAISLYERLGFGIKKRLRSFYRDGCDAYLMEACHA